MFLDIWDLFKILGLSQDKLIVQQHTLLVALLPNNSLSSAIFMNISKFSDKFAVLNIGVSKAAFIMGFFYLTKMSGLDLDKLTISSPIPLTSSTLAISTNMDELPDNLLELIPLHFYLSYYPPQLYSLTLASFLLS